MTKKTLLLAVKLAITIIIILAICWFVDPEQLRRTLNLADRSLLLLALLLLIPNLFIQYKKWRYLVGLVHQPVRSAEVWRSVLAGVALGLTPGRVGEVAKLFMIKDGDRIRLLGMALVEKVYEVLPVLFV